MDRNSKIIDIDIDLLEILRKELWAEMGKAGCGRLEKFWTVTYTENERFRQFDMAFYRASMNALVKQMEAAYKKRLDELEKPARVVDIRA